MHKPTNVYIGITTRCNMRCRHCRIWARPWHPSYQPLFMKIYNRLERMMPPGLLRKSQRKELSQKEWMDILIDLKHWLGPYNVSFSGGEPFMREDMVDIIYFCHENGIRPIVNTNATLLTPQIISALSGLQSLTLNISLDGITPRMHDYLRGVPCTYQKVMEALRRFADPARQCSIGILTVLMGYNCDEILNIVKFFREERLADSISFQALDNASGLLYDNAWFHKNDLWPKDETRDKLIGIIEELISLKKNGVNIWNPVDQLRKMQKYFINPNEDVSDKCASAKNNFILNPWGEVALCWSMRPIAPYCRKPEVIWESDVAEKMRKILAGCRRTCKLLNCNFNQDL